MKTFQPKGLPRLGASSKFTTLEYAPIVVTRMPRALTDADVELLIAGFDALFAGEMTYAALLDARSLQEAPSPRQRKRLTDWAEETIPLAKTFGMCSSYVITSTIVRASLTAIGWIYEHPTPMKYVATMPEAVDFCSKQVTARGFALPANLDELRRLPAV